MTGRARALFPRLVKSQKYVERNAEMHYTVSCVRISDDKI